MATRKSQTAEAEIEKGAEAGKEAADKSVEAVETAAQQTGAATETVADAAGEGAEAVSSTTDEAIDRVVLTQQHAVETVEASTQVMMESVTRFQREIADFVAERVRHDMETQQELLRCRNFDEFRAVQTRFFQTAMDQYSAEASKLMRMGQEVIQKSLARPQ